MNSIAELSTCAEGHLAHYVDPSGPRGFWSYDRQGDPARLEPIDAFASGLLDAPLRGSVVIELFAERDTAYSRLRRSMQELLDETLDLEPAFEDIDLNDLSGPWGLVSSVLDHTDSTRWIKASIVTKILHRKRPRLVPIFDSKIASFYGATPRAPWQLWPRLQSDLRSAFGLLSELSDRTVTPDGRKVSPLRVADIVIWEHEVTGCALST
jgi:hypothetical protein